MMDRVKRMRGKTPLEQMLNAEYLFVKDPDNLAVCRGHAQGGGRRPAISGRPTGSPT